MIVVDVFKTVMFLYLLGGWILIANVSFTDPSLAQSIFHNTMVLGSKISEIGDISSGNKALRNDQMMQLYRFTDFTEIRLFCHKPWHGRTVHVILNIVQAYLFGNIDVDYCGKTRYLADDTSLIKTRLCSHIKCARKCSNIYDHLFYVGGSYHVHFSSKNRFECDDHSKISGFQNTGTWFFYVR